MVHNIRSGAIRWQIPDVQSEPMFTLSLTTYEILAYQIELQKFDLENEGQCQIGENRELSHSTGNVRF